MYGHLTTRCFLARRGREVFRSFLCCVFGAALVAGSTAAAGSMHGRHAVCMSGMQYVRHACSMSEIINHK